MAAVPARSRRRHPDLFPISDAGEDSAEENIQVDSDSGFDGPLAVPSSPRIMLSPRSPALPLRRRGALKMAKNPPFGGLFKKKSTDHDASPISAPTVASRCSQLERSPPALNAPKAKDRRSVLLAQPFAQGRINSALKKNKEGASLLESLSSPSAQRNGDDTRCLPDSPSKSKRSKDKRQSVLQARPQCQQRINSARQKEKDGGKTLSELIESPSAQRRGWETDGTSPDTWPQVAPSMPESECVEDQPTKQLTNKPRPKPRATRQKMKSD